MTLREQIKEIHKKHFSQEFHEYRQDLIPAMVNDLKMKFFDDLTGNDEIYYIQNTVDIRAVREASMLIGTIGLRENIPAVE